MSEGLLLVRLVIGVLMVGHGTQKLFGWFGGPGLAGTAVFFDALGFRPGRLFAGAAAAGELVSGLLVALGFLGPVGPAVMVMVMVVAAVSVHGHNGIFAASNGIELPLVYAAAASALTLTGPGAYSLDAILGLAALSAAPVTWTALAIGVAGGFVNLAARRSVPVAV